MGREPSPRAGAPLAGSSCRRAATEHPAFHQSAEAGTAERGVIVSSLPVDQHMARVNLPEKQWLEFRALAIREKRSVAAYLGRLVDKEIDRMARVDQRRSQRAVDEPKDVQTRAPAHEIEVDDDWVPPWEI